MSVDAICGATPIDELSVALLGPGRVGGSLASWLRDRGAGITWIVGRTLASARTTAEIFGAEASEAETLLGKPWNLLLLAPPDDSLAEIAEALARGATPGRRLRIALHTSGSQTAEVLAPLRQAGFSVGSLHPLLGFPAVRRRPIEGTVYGVDGDEEARDLALGLARAFSGHGVEIPARQRFLYHYCATLAAGGVSTLLAVIDELLERLDLDPEVRGGMLNLTRTAVDAAGDAADAAATITGPIARGDAELARRQLLAALDRIADLEPFLRGLHSESERQVARRRRQSVGNGE